MMGFREIRTRERMTEEDERKQNYKKIKPQSEMSVEELNQMINDVFSSLRNED